MCDNSGPDWSLDQMIPSFVGQYRRKRDDNWIPQIIVIDLDSELSKKEKCVCDFFKCTRNWCQTNEESDDIQLIETTSSLNQKAISKKCFATRHSTLNFQTHLQEKHASDELFCAYCYDSMDNKTVLKLYSHRYLMKHMMKRHRFRRFQCNLCLFRAITEEHVILHQKFSHSNEFFDATVSKSSDENVCKIFVCPKMTEEVKTLYYFWRKFKTQRLNCRGITDTLHQCLYCDYMNEMLPKVVQHCAQKHPDYPLLYYIPEPQVSSSTITRIPDSSSDNYWNAYQKMAIVRPKRLKIEPQDNCVSSTQKSPETDFHSVSETNLNSVKRNLDSEEDRNGVKRLRTDSSDSNSNNVNNNQSISKVEQMVEPITDQKYTICLFCTKKLDKIEPKKHLESHLKLSSIKEGYNLQPITSWIQTFVSKQWQLCSFIDSVEASPKKAYYFCPLCVKLGKLHNRIAKNYKTFSEVRYHLWQHCCWLSVKCKYCHSLIPNSDPIIAKHFKENHFSLIKKSQKLEFLLSDESNFSFNVEQRQQLEKKLIEVNCNQNIEKRINKLLNKTKEDFEQQWRDIKKVDKTPDLIIEPISKKVFEKYHKQFQDYEVIKVQNDKSLSQTEKDSKIIEIIDRRCDEQKKKKNKRKHSNKSKELIEQSSSNSKKNTHKTSKKVDKCRDLLRVIDTTVDTIKSSVGTSGQSSSHIPNESEVRNSLPSSDSRETTVNREPDEDEDSNRVICYHCTERFMTKSDCKRHSKDKHPNQIFRMFSKPRRTRD